MHALFFFGLLFRLERWTVNAVQSTTIHETPFPFHLLVQKAERETRNGWLLGERQPEFGTRKRKCRASLLIAYGEDVRESKG